MRKRRMWMVELGVATAVLAVLLVVMLPRFMGSQVRVKIAQSLRDMDRIYESLKVYNEEHTDDPVQLFYLQSIKASGEDLDPSLTIETGTIKKSYPTRGQASVLEETEKFPDPFLDTLKPIPVPPLPQELYETPMANSPGAIYAIESRLSRNRRFDFNPNPRSNGKCEQALFNFHYYYGGYDYGYLGAASGPMDDQRIFPPAAPPNHLMFSYYVPYDPTNGVISQGFLVSKWDMVPEEQRYEGKKPNLEDPSNIIYQYPLKNDPIFSKENKPASPVASASPIVDSGTLLQLHRDGLASLELQLRGEFIDWWGIDYTFDLQNRLKKRVIEGSIPGGVTMDEVNQFFKDNRYGRRYPIEYIYYKSGDKERRIVQTPRMAKFPWPTCFEKIWNEDLFISISHVDGSINAGYRDPNETNEIRSPFSQYEEFPVSSILYPLSLLPQGAVVNIEPIQGSLLRVTWENISPNESIWKLDVVLDPALGYKTHQCLLQFRKVGKFINPNPRMGVIRGNTPAPRPVLQHNSDVVEVHYIECDDYRPVDGDFIPRLLLATNWTHYSTTYRSGRDVNAPGTYTGLEVPNPILNQSVPRFRQQWRMETTFARVNQPVEDSVFNADQEKFGNYSHPAWLFSADRDQFIERQRQQRQQRQQRNGMGN